MANKKKTKVLNENFDTEEKETDEELKAEEKADEAGEDIAKDSAEDGDEEIVDDNESADDGEENADDNADDSDAEADGDSEDEDKKGLFDKKKKKNKHEKLIDELNDKVMRQMAEFENFRKRTEKEKGQMYDMGAKTILEKILPVVDNFERGLDSAEEGDSFADGMKMVYKQLMTSLEEAGVKEIEAEGEEFNPDYHNAVMHVEDEELGENVVVEVLQKGYMYNDTVLRHAMVKVAN